MIENPYIRVATSYLKKVEKPLMSKDTVEILIPWNKDTIISDHGKDYLSKIPCFDGFCCIPSHINYQQQIGTFYNQYYELKYKPKAGDCSLTLEFIRHIFQSQYEIGLDYLKILYEHPHQILPILCLVSSERGTGKTTFLNFLKMIFDKNMTLNTNDDFRSQFNSDWANKLIIAIDEVLLDKREDSERIKNLSTARQFKAEAKGKDRQEIEFFGKFILCSNNETSFIYLDKEEIRYWVIQVPPFCESLKNKLDTLMDILKSEIPMFLYFLINREYSTQKQSRMWFTPKQIETKALFRLKQSNTSFVEREIADILFYILERRELDKVQFQIQDIVISMENRRVRKSISYSDIQSVVKTNWGLISKNSSYTKYIICYDGEIISSVQKGRFYTITKLFLIENFVDLLNL
ncbi:MAG: DUF5906 domain-containing protein [Prevotella sp.]|jgi:energy-coupling factor transporter ATP-binding protein EcfA2|nr:DUF5906 domain-containing protein [Prevotella sp.]